jgi:hypothetical protein
VADIDSGLQKFIDAVNNQGDWSNALGQLMATQTGLNIGSPPSSPAELSSSKAPASQMPTTNTAAPSTGSTGGGFPPSFGALGGSMMFSGAAQGGSATPLAAGFPIVSQMVDMLLRANADRRASIDQSVNIARLFADLERISPTRAADMATRLGVDQGQVDLSFLNLFGSGAQFAQAGGPRIGGQVGGQNVSLPGTFSGQEMSFFNSNPNVARIVMDVADKFGLPDIFDRSAASQIPTVKSMFGGGF